MKLTVHDVGHGSCISLIHDNGNVMLWDCGHAGTYRPSAFLPNEGIQRIDRLFVTNFDEDHISDLVQLRTNIQIGLLHRNESISREQLRSLKLESGPISPAMQSMLDMMGSYTYGPPVTPPLFPGVTYNVYWNSYLTDFNDTNNISLVTFINCNGVKFVIPGDLEKQGWETLLQYPQFRSELSDVDIFIASHHGRESGYCRQVFDYCTPKVIVFSDSAVKHATQEMANVYASHASGITFNGGTTRFVLSTRNDGSVWWDL